MKARLLAAAFACCGALVLVAVIGTGLGWWNSAPSQGAPAAPLVVRTAVSPSVILFGDPLVARVSVDLDRSAVSPGSLRVEPSFEPFVASTAPKLARVRTGRLETLEYTYSLQCVTDGCLPSKGSLAVKLPRVVVTAMAGTRRLSVSQKWPSIVVASRLQHGGRTTFEAGSTLPAVTYATAPSRLANVLLVVGVLVALGALILVGLELRSASRRRRERISRTRLAAAIAYVRESAERDNPADRRKALEGLAEALESEGEPDLAQSAGRLAWAEPQPTPERALALADAVDATPEAEET
jgi:hypothetical protein